MPPAVTPSDKRPKVSCEEYLVDSVIRDGVRDGKYFIGKHHVPRRWGHDRTFVQNSVYFPRQMDICIENRKDRNRALDEEIVAVEITGWADKAASPVSPVSDQSDSPLEPCFAEDTKDNTEAESNVSFRNRMQAKKGYSALLNACETYSMPSDINWEENKQPLGKIVAVLYPKPHLIIGRVLPETDRKPDVFFKVEPYNSKFPRAVLRQKDVPRQIATEIHEHLLLVKTEPHRWLPQNNYVPVKFIKSLGYAKTVDAESSAILCALGVDESSFSDAVMESVATNVSVPPPGETCEGRTDLRESEFVCSIDPSTARDLDDAMSIRKLKNGNFKVGVHIADVTAYVPEGSVVDEEARQRSTSCYLTQRVIPMLPPALSEDKCSLNTRSDKFAFSVMWELTRHGEIVPGTEWMGKTIVRNNCQLAYEDAQIIIDKDDALSNRLASLDEATLHKVKKSVSNLWTLAHKIRSQRFSGGSINLDQPKLSFVMMDNDSALAPTDFYIKKQTEANFLIEEFMLLANRRVAVKLYAYLPRAALLRSHAKPKADCLRFYKMVLERLNIDFSIASAANLAASLREIAVTKEMKVYISAMIIRSISRAKYRLGIESVEEPLWHFALNMDLYTHFTSPIRRYADLHVHRLLYKVLEFEKKKASGESVVELTELDSSLFPSVDVCTHINDKQNKARNASDQSQDLFLSLYLENLRKVSAENGGETAPYRTGPARVVKVRRRTILVYVEDIASFVEVEFRSYRQLWHDMRLCETDISVYVDWKAIAEFRPETKKGTDAVEKAFKAMSIGDKKNSKAEAGKEVVDEKELPKLSLLQEITVSLVVGNQSPLSFDAIIHPPEYHGKPLPVPLLDLLRCKK